MSKHEIILTSVIGFSIATLLLLIILVIVSNLPITDSGKTMVLVLLGIVFFTIGYEVLITMEPKKPNAKPATNNPKTGSQDFVKGSSDIHRILSHIPEAPKIAIATKYTAIMKHIKTIIAFISFYLKRIFSFFRFI